MSQSRVEQALESLARRALESRALGGRVAALAARYAAVLREGGTLFFCGNGGSAADAQHLATEYVVRYGDTRPAFSAIALTTDSSLLTAAGNDFGFDRIFARQIEALCRAGDLLVLHSTSGRSPNLVCAARAARAKGVFTVAFLGQGGGPLAEEVDEAVMVPTKETSEIQILQLALEHVIVELVEAELGSVP
ncbi:MAG: SIS domain-containing protein [Gemmatimonadales bacterium]|nr:SIS domain-containing protein [Gemmatimonadales bacterium]